MNKFALYISIALCLTFSGGLVLGFIERCRRRFIIHKTSFNKIDRMTGTEFELYLCKLYECRGYQVQHMGHSGDYGCDLLVKKAGITTAVQAKRYKNNVGIKAVQEVYSAKDYFKANRAEVVTTAHFTKAAKNLAYKLGVTLIDRDTLSSYINSI